MKKLLFAMTIVLLLSSCAAVPTYLERTSFLNYETYNKLGVFISESNSVSFEYTPLGSISTTVLSGNAKEVVGKVVYQNEIYGNDEKDKIVKVWKTADTDSALSMAVAEVKKQGGNGLINLKIQPITENIKGTIHYGFLVTGMAIKK